MTSTNSNSSGYPLAILGAGVMGETVLSGLLRAGWHADQIVATDRRPERRQELAARYGIQMLENTEAVAEAETVILVVKPQDMRDLLAEIAESLKPGALVVSLAAGVDTVFIESRLPEGVAVVRVMPNTPAQVDEGMAAISPGSHSTQDHLDRVTEILSATGRVITVPERYQDAVTAISGTGPAYLFFVVEAMIEAGVHLGLPRDTATELVVQTMLGSAKLLRETGEHPTVLRERVTSPGGTTAAAVRQLEDHKVRAAFLVAMEAARDRSRELAAAARENKQGTRGRQRMSDGLLVFSEDLTKYDFGSGHPMAPGRVTNTISLARQLGVFDRLRIVPPPNIDLALLETVHTPDYIAAVQRGEPNQRYGLGTSDNPIFPGMHEIAASVTMASVEAARRVWTGDAQRASNISGGLHHAMPGYTSGFCVYNDVAVAIRWLLDNGCERVGYVDVDVHHGDGVQAIFYDEPRVMTVSLHETPAYLFPGTGFPNEIGGRGAEGTAVNVALPPGTTDADWLRAFHAVVPQVLRAHKPSVLVTQHGCDSHRQDPLADLNLTLDGQRASYLALASLADELCGGRWVSTGWGRVCGARCGASGLDSSARHREWRAYRSQHVRAGGVAALKWRGQRR